MLKIYIYISFDLPHRRHAVECQIIYYNELFKIIFGWMDHQGIKQALFQQHKHEFV